MDREGNNKVRDCIRPIKLDKRTASFSKEKHYQKMKIAAMILQNEEDSSISHSERSVADDSNDESEANEESENEYFDKEDEQEDKREENDERKSWYSTSD